MPRFEILLEGYVAGVLSESELQELVSLVNTDSNQDILEENIMLNLKDNLFKGLTDTELRNKMFRNISEKTEVKKATPVIRFWWMAAASILFLIGIGSYFYFTQTGQKQVAQTKKQPHLKNDIAPGGNRAMLTLADGSQIVLDTAVNGTITRQGNTKIIKLNNGELSYNRLNEKSNEVFYNTISTPKGGEYQIVLSDGSKVWLNAASSLKFPTLFTGKERNVELTGEGYFEIAKNASMPFHVKVNDMQVEVLGTHFNVNAYNDEETIKTTLLEGSVKVSKGSENSLLKPGQQAQLYSNGKLKVVAADVDQVIAWKDGRFYFDGADIKTIMRQISRWYDVEVNYQAEITYSFVAKITRNVPISKLLKLLELTEGVHFKIEGKKITVMK